MPELILHGFPRSTYVNICRMALALKELPYRFADSETIMGSDRHRELHPFMRMPALEYGDFKLYETSAIAIFIDENFPGPRLQPQEVKDRAHMHQWISAVNDYYYPRIVFNLGHERMVFPELGIPTNEKVVAKILPKVVEAMDVLERALSDGRHYLVGDALSLADLFMLPSIWGMSRIPEGILILAQRPHATRWMTAMSSVPKIAALRQSVPINVPIEHARAWATEHRASA